MRIMKNRRPLSFILLFCMLFTMMPMSVFAGALPETIDGQDMFSDVTGHWASKAIHKWAGLGVIKGDSRGFRPNDSITRAEMAAILDNLMDYQKRASNSFSDVDNKAWYADAVLKANAAGILNGDGAGHATPAAEITREQAAAMLARAFAVDEKEGSLTSFKDVGNIAPWAKKLVFGMEEDKYIGGMGNGNFDPKANITRAQVVTIIDNAVKAYYTKQGTYTENVAPDAGANCVAIVRTDGVTIKGSKINGDLIIAEGVAQGNFTLDSTTVTGKLVARGGGENSIHIINGAAVNGRVSIERVDGVVRVISDGVVIANLDASTEVILEGDFTNIVVGEGADVEIRGQVANISVEAKAEVTVAKDAKVGTLTINKEAEGARVEVAGTVTNVKTEAPKTEVIATETAKITNVEATDTAAGTNIAIDKNAEIKTLNSSAEITTSGSGAPKTVTGTGTITPKETTDQEAPLGGGGGAPMGGGGGGAPSGGEETTASVSSATIKGKIKVNAVLSVDTVSSGNVGTLTYQWYRTTTNGAINTSSDAAIGANSTYQLTISDKDKYIYYIVSGSGSLRKESSIVGPIEDAAVPSEKVTNLSFIDIDREVNEIGGTLHWTEPTSLSNITGYNIYTSSDGAVKGTLITTTAVNTTQVAIQQNITLSNYILTVCRNATGEATTFTSITVTDVFNLDQAAPTGLSGVVPTSALNNGKITGVTTAMEYKMSSGAVYIAVTGTEVTGLTAGTYLVRYSAKEGYNAGTPASVEVPEYVAADQYGLVKAFEQTTGTLAAMVRLLNANGLTINYDISSYLDVELTKGQLVAYGLKEPGEIGAVIPTNSAISFAPGLKILSADELTINGTSYDILDSAVIFTYDGATPGAAICNYDIATMDDVVYNVSAVSPASVYFDDESKVAALLIPISLLEGPVIPTAIIQQPSALTITEGGIANFTVVATGSSLSFQWQESTNSGSHFSNISNGGGYNGERSPTLVINPATYIMNNYIYRVQVSGSSGAAVSSNASLIVTTNAPTVGANPSPATVMEGDSVSFSSWSNGWLTSHKWQVSSNGGITFDNIANGGIYSGAGSPTLTISPASLGMNGYLYRLVFYGPGGSAVTSSAALTVNAAPSTPLITGKPSPASIYDDGHASFTVTAAGLNLTYQWQVSTDGGIQFGNISNGSPYSSANTKSLIISPASLSLNGYLYRAVVNGTGGTAISSSAGLTVNPLLFIASQPLSVTVSEGGIANFSVSATGIGLGYLYYQWQVSNDNGYSYANIPGMSGYGAYGMGVGPVSGIIHDGLMYRVVITAGGKTVTSNGAELTVDSPPIAPTISTPPVSATSAALGSASFSVTASTWQGSLDYQWQLSTDGGSHFNNITNGGLYSGALTPALAINPVSLSMSGYQYRVIVHCSNGLATTSSAVTLTVVSPVAITVNPVSAMLTAGGIASFSVTASGTDLQYNWTVSNNGGTSYNDIFDITGLSGEHTSTLVVSPAAMSMNGYRFRVEVSGFGGTAISSSAALTVVAEPDVQLTGLTENLSDDFSPSFAGNVYVYNINATASESAVNLTPTLDGAVISWDVDTDSTDAQYVTSGSIAAIPIEMGVNIITVHVEKAGTTSKDYEITVSRLSDKLTIMVYGDGDNDLETYLLDDIAEMKSGVTGDVNLIVLVDRAEGHTGRSDVLDGNFEDTRLYRISSGAATRISGESYFPGITINSSIEMNMGDASTLCDFIDYCKEYYSADKYMLVLWNHGGGSRSLAGNEQKIDAEKSICEDETSGDLLYTAEISDELSSAQSVDILGFDACLMGSIEVAYQYRPGGSGFSADTMVASAPNVWGYGWDYDEILRRLNSNLAGQESGDTDLTLGGNELYYDPTGITNATLGAIIVEEQRDSTPEDSDQSLAFYDLSLVDDVKNEVDAFAASLSSAYSTTLAAVTIETIRNNALAYFDPTDEDEMIDTPFYDLYDLADGISSGSADPTVVSHANLVKGIVDQFVLYSFAKFDGFNEGSNGVSIFFPDGDATYIQPVDGKSYPHWAYQWWYTPLDTQLILIESDLKYGKLKWCIDGLSQTTEAVSNWFELLDYWYDDLHDTDRNFYSFVDPTIADADSTSSAISLTIDDPMPNQVIYPTGDIDWFKFDAAADTDYAIDVYNQFGGSRAEISLYDEDGATQLTSGSSITCNFGPDAGTYYIKVINVFTDSPYSIERYDIIVTRQ